MHNLKENPVINGTDIRRATEAANSNQNSALPNEGRQSSQVTTAAPFYNGERVPSYAPTGPRERPAMEVDNWQTPSLEDSWRSPCSADIWQSPRSDSRPLDKVGSHSNNNRKGGEEPIKERASHQREDEAIDDHGIISNPEQVVEELKFEAAVSL